MRWCTLLGIAEGTTRVTLSRMVDAGELATDAGRYELAGPLRARQAGQDWSLAPVLLPWSGAWDLWVVRPGARDTSSRTTLRRAAAAARLVERHDGVWGRPDNLPPEATPVEARGVLTGQAERWSARPDPTEAIDVPAAFSLADSGRARHAAGRRPRAHHRGARRRRPGPAGSGVRPRRGRPPAGPPRPAPPNGADRTGVARSRPPRRVRRVPARVRHRGRLLVRRCPIQPAAGGSRTRSSGPDHGRSPRHHLTRSPGPRSTGTAPTVPCRPPTSGSRTATTVPHAPGDGSTNVLAGLFPTVPEAWRGRSRDDEVGVHVDPRRARGRTISRGATSSRPQTARSAEAPDSPSGRRGPPRPGGHAP